MKYYEYTERHKIIIFGLFEDDTVENVILYQVYFGQKSKKININSKKKTQIII